MTRVLSLSVVMTMALGIYASSHASELHVAINGSDSNPGTQAAPLRTIQRGAAMAQPGDTVTVHEGTYRERINPPRGGESDARRIVYQAAPGEKVELRGSEVVKGWIKVQNDTWKATVPNSLFAGFNPYSDLIRGDWFDPKGRKHHTGAVYLNDDWLIEATKLDEVLAPAGSAPVWLARAGHQYLLNVAWLRPGKDTGDAGRIPATSFAAKNGTQNAACSEGGECIGFIEHGHWVRYDQVDFGPSVEQLEIRAASASDGGTIEIRLDKADGELLGTCAIPNTGDWQSWSSFIARIKPVDGTKTLCLVFKAPRPSALNAGLWFAKVEAPNTMIWAQFPGVDPNEQRVEINVRRTVFYPDQPGRNYITVRGFAMRHAATPWAPPTAEQIGLIGTHWSKGWIIENNLVSHSVCSGISLGKHGDEFDNTSANTAEGYVKTIERGLKRGWNKETIGHHIVRNNTVTHCEQAGIVGSLGPIFSLVTGNTIHDIHVRQLFGGAEMAGIKFHGAIDTEISHNHIYRCCQGLWLDWMAQGTLVTGNLFHDNGWQDLFFEVDHGPFLVDNNLLLSRTSLLNMSEGGAYAHNLFAGRILPRPELSRETPFHPAHTTEVAGLRKIVGGDDRFYNNLFAGPEGLVEYDTAKQPVWMDGNVFLKGAKPSKHEKAPLIKANHDPALKVVEKPDGWHLEITLDNEWMTERSRKPVTTDLLGKAAIPNLPYERPDGSPIRIDTDYFGKPRKEVNPSPGPLENPGAGRITIKVWPDMKGKS
ncbi:MAG TPA: carbohydrate-binding protein [Phycisphaerae bacterium]|nr:carbohydrate-binding protein [Phycisphaerae bacterium]HRY66663.1 carbohydrate-binding protein [Phycisphaerae bacterium]HSA27634.1 carbohydrate-binding protein [Phycisphaerae bacterium]